jgi:peptidoglycan hydrolase-like protein with peptidoglycan-binding domain
MRRATLLLLSLLLAVPAVAGLAMAATAAKKPAAKAAAPQAKQAPAAVVAREAAAPQARLAPPAAAARQDAPAARNAALAARKARIARSAKARAAKARGPQKPDPVLIAAYAAMPVADRRAIQSDLIWTGDYNGIISDEFGERSIAAVKSYQARSGAADTGILTGEQRIALAAAAKAKQEESGWHVVDDTATGARLGVPTKHAPQSSATRTGTRWTSGRGEVQIETFRIAEPGTTLAAVFEQQKKEPANREVEYSVLRETSFVLAGLQGLKRFYVRAHARQNDVRGVAVMYDQAMQGTMDRVAIAMSSRFEPFPSAPAGPSTRHKVEYATGVVVDELGHVITDRQVTDSCLVITLAGLGNVELLAETADLALLRLYGARNLKPLAMGDGANVRDVTLVGIADPQAQGGGGMATTVVARLGTAENAKRALEPAPALGFSGAAVTDTKGRLVGLVQLKGALVAGPTNVGAPAQLVPIEQIKAFLNGRNIAPAAAAASSPEAAKASVLRVICVRK